jgi:RNA polymerase sigma-70 factor (ECF subfamily)
VNQAKDREVIAPPKGAEEGTFMCKSDEELMAAYVTGDESAFAELFRRYASMLARFFARRGKRVTDGQDLVQETFLHLHRGRYDFRLGDPLRPWLFTIARNLCNDHGRRQLRRPEQLGDLDVYAAAGSEPAAGMLFAERARSLTDALSRLPDGDRRLVDEHWFEERSFTEIAARDGIHSTTLRVRAHRACAKLREWIPVVHSAAA